VRFLPWWFASGRWRHSRTRWQIVHEALGRSICRRVVFVCIESDADWSAWQPWAQGYAEVIAYILANNGFPDGARELPASQPALEGIIIEPKK